MYVISVDEVHTQYDKGFRYDMESNSAKRTTDFPRALKWLT